MTLNFIGGARINKKEVLVFRNEHGKFYVKINGNTTQKRLTASEIVRYLLNARHR